MVIAFRSISAPARILVSCVGIGVFLGAVGIYKPFAEFAKNRAAWAVETDYVYPGPIQYFGPSEVCDLVTKTLELEKA